MTEPTVITMPDPAQAEKSVAELTQAMEIIDKHQHELAQGFLVDCVAVKREIVALFKPSKSLAKQTKDAIYAAEKKLLGPVEDRRQAWITSIGEYEGKERKRVEDLRRKQAAEEKLREETRLKAEAEKLKKSEAPGLAGAMSKQAESVPEPQIHIEPELAKTPGVSSRTTWSVEVTNKAELIAFVAMNLRFQSLLTPDMVRLTALAREAKENFNIPGVEAVPTVTQVVRPT